LFFLFLELPQYLKETGWASSEQTVLVCVAMRITAISLATRVAEECDCALGSDVMFEMLVTINVPLFQ
jgi:HrpA-like RNA helicase